MVGRHGNYVAGCNDRVNLAVILYDSNMKLTCEASAKTL